MGDVEAQLQWKRRQSGCNAGSELDAKRRTARQQEYVSRTDWSRIEWNLLIVERWP